MGYMANVSQLAGSGPGKWECGVGVGSAELATEIRGRTPSGDKSLFLTSIVLRWSVILETVGLVS